jgi:hypothetical protein
MKDRLFDVKIGQSGSAIEEERGEDKRVQIIESADKFYVQENTVSESGQKLNQKTIGRARRDPENAIRSARRRVSKRVEGIDAVEFERQVPSGKFAPEGTEPDASVPPDRGPEGRFVSGRRKPVDTFGRREIDGLFSQFDRPPRAPFRDGPPQTDTNTGQPEADISDPRNDAVLSEAQAEAGLSDDELGIELFSAQAQAADVSLTADEAFRGVGAQGRDNRGSGDVPVTDRFGRFDKDPEQEQQELDRIAAEKASTGMPKSVIESFAAGEEADMAFAQAERERASEDRGMFDIKEVMGGR